MGEADEQLLEEVVILLQEARMEIAALRSLLIEKKVISADDLRAVLEDVKTEEYVSLKSEVLRRSWDKSWKSGAKQ